jgi:dUTP pyrophosphatase
MEKTRQRGFEVVTESKRQNFDVYTNEKGQRFNFPVEIKLPTRADVKSAGYDMYLPKDIKLLPMQKTIIWLDIKSYMQEDEVLEIYIRSSLAIKQGLMLSNNVGIIDSSYYNNEGNEGNIGVAVVNTTGLTIELKAGDRICQGIFKKFLTADEDNVTSQERVGGFGSSGK